MVFIHTTFTYTAWTFYNHSLLENVYIPNEMNMCKNNSKNHFAQEKKLKKKWFQETTLGSVYALIKVKCKKLNQKY